jgi:carbonic anhydrase/acetyltransferase-like protein (isoleucine patch superfamily)
VVARGASGTLLAMPVYALGDVAPRIHPDAFVAAEAVIIGDVEIGAEATIWPCAVLRGDENLISVGARTSIQDGAVLHCTSEHATRVGAECVIGHLVHLEGCTIEDGALVGSSAVVLHEAVVKTGAFVAANAVVRNRMIIPEGALALGVPAQIRENAADRAEIVHGMQSYLAKRERYLRELRRIS